MSTPGTPSYARDHDKTKPDAQGRTGMKKGGRPPTAAVSHALLSVYAGKFGIVKLRGMMGRSQARGILFRCNDVAIWTRLLVSKDERVVLAALEYLSDKRDGKAKQTIETQERGTITVVHVQGERPPWAPPPPAALPAGEQEYLEGADGD